MPTIKRKVTHPATLSTTKLHVGQQLTYAQICELTGAPKFSGGSSKNAQLSDTLKEHSFRRYFDYEKVGRGLYEITEIYDKPLPVSDGRKYGNNSVYCRYIELILMQYLAFQEGHVELFSKHKLWMILGMINNKYGRVTQKTLANKNPILTEFEVNHFYQRSKMKLSSILKSALNNLKARRLIEWSEEILIQGSDGKWFVGTDSDKEEVLKVEHEVLREYGFEKIFQVYASFKQASYFKDVTNILQKNFHWNTYYRRIKIIYNKENMIEAIPQTEIDLQKTLLNNEVSGYLDKEAHKIYDHDLQRYNEAIERGYMETGIIPNEFTENHLPKTYIAAQELLVNELIRTGNKKSYVSLDQIINLSACEEIDSIFA